MCNIILASNSPRRKQLLEWAEIDFEVVTKNMEETFPPNMLTDEVPVYIAREKALRVNEFLQSAYHKQYANIPILAADTVVIYNNTIIGKPKNRQDAVRILQELSGKIHKVITGVVILNDEKETAFSDITEVEFNELTLEQIEYYIDKYQPFDKAGAYGIQEWIGVIGIKNIKGDFYNVMGLPINRVVQVLEKL